MPTKKKEYGLQNDTVGAFPSEEWKSKIYIVRTGK